MCTLCEIEFHIAKLYNILHIAQIFIEKINIFKKNFHKLPYLWTKIPHLINCRGQTIDNFSKNIHLDRIITDSDFVTGSCEKSPQYLVG